MTKKTKQLTKKQLTEIQLLNKYGYAVGEKVIGSRGEIYRVSALTKKGYKLESKWGSEDWSSYGTIEYDRYYPKLDPNKSLEDYDKELANYIINGLPEEVPSECRALVSTNKQQADMALQEAEKKRTQVAVLERMLERKKDVLGNMVSKLNDQVKHIMKVVGIIELYLGVSEEIVQLQEGLNASDETPLSLRQLVLHMDEETAITGEEAFDYDDIDLFDDWIRKNYDSVLPEMKSVIVFRPRRNKKHYSDNALENANMNDGNFSTYVLIRNGQNLYRIATNHNIYPYLFPSAGEMEQLTKTVNDADGWGSDRSKAEDEQLKYKRNVLLLQGLVDRTNIFNLPPDLSLLKPDTYKDRVQFIYDGSNLIDDGTEDFFTWLKRTNQTVKRGSRVYFRGYSYNESKDDRMASVGWETWRTDDPYWTKPDRGIYNISRVNTSDKDYYRRGDKEQLVFLFKPNDTVYADRYSCDSHERKRSNTYYLYKSDTCFINYDELSLEQVDNYLSSRTSKRHYLEILPLLRGIRKQLVKERKLENDFKALVRSQIKKCNNELLNEAVKWWKYKVIEKRPLMKDDAKALRMICKRYERLIKDNT